MYAYPIDFLRDGDGAPLVTCPTITPSYV